MRGLVWAAEIAVAGYLTVVAGLYLCQRQLLYHPDRARPVLGTLARLGVREVAVPTADGLSLLAWYLPATGERPVLVYFHGNGGHIGYRADRIERFAREGYGALMLEYRGYGGNPGMPSEAGLFEDAAAALRFVAAQGAPGHRIVLYGESLGTGVTVHVATSHAVGAVVLESPYTSIAAAAQYHYPFIPAAWLVSDRYDSLSRIGQVRAPVLMLHGARRRHPVEPRRSLVRRRAGAEGAMDRARGRARRSRLVRRARCCGRLHRAACPAERTGLSGLIRSSRKRRWQSTPTIYKTSPVHQAGRGA